MKKIFLILTSLLSLALMAQEKTWTLQDCIQYALDNDLSLKEAALDTEFYQKEITAAYGNLLPNAALYADHQYNFGSVIDPTTNARVSSDIQSNSLSFSSNIELFNWGNFIHIQTTKLQKEKAKFDQEIKKNELIVRIVQTFTQIQYDKEQIELLENQLKNTEITLNQIQKEFELGNKAKSDVYELMANKISEEQLLLLARNAFKVSETAMLNLLNLKEKIDFLSTEELRIAPLQDEVEELYAVGSALRPEIKSANLQKEIARKKIQLQRSNFLPRINGNYSLSSFYVDLETASLRDQFKNNKNHYLGLSIQMPLFNRWQTRTAIQQAKIEWAQADLQVEQQKQAYFNALREVFTQTENAYDNWRKAEENVAAQEISFEKTEEKYRLGMLDAYGYFAAKNGLLNAQNALLQAKYNYHYQSVLLQFYVTNEW
ncbi:MAG: TolC family protein [Weeksellaceae bacterium]